MATTAQAALRDALDRINACMMHGDLHRKNHDVRNGLAWATQIIGALLESLKGDGCDDWFKVEPSAIARLRVLMSTQSAALDSVAQYIISLAGCAMAAQHVTASISSKPSDPAEPEPAVHVPQPKPPTRDGSAAVLAYDFRDPLGHPLAHCVEFIRLARRADLATSFALAVAETAA